MMMLFNTTFELSLRTILLLTVAERKDMTLDRLVAYDFITIYGSYFGLVENNLHGENDYSFSEFATRRELLNQALKSLVLDGLVRVSHKKVGFCYEITDAGLAFSKRQNTEYAKTYKTMVVKTNHVFGNYSEIKLLTMISNKAKEALRR